MNVIKDIFKIIGNYFLNGLSLCLLWLLYIPNIIAQIITAKNKKATLKETAKMQFEDAYNIDVFGAFVYQELWNITVVQKKGYLFGTDEYKTISWYLAKNKEIKKLTDFGYFLYHMILIVDFTTWFKGGHYHFYKKQK